MATVQFGRKVVSENNILSSNVLRQPLSLAWPTEAGALYSVFLIGRTGRSSQLHYSIVNVPRNELTRGQVLAGYLPPDINSDRYDLYIYRQGTTGRPRTIVSERIADRSNFDLGGWVSRYNLYLVASVTFRTRDTPLSRVSPPTVVSVVPGSVRGVPSKTGKEYFKDPSKLSQEEQKYCRCFLHVMGQQNRSCLEGRAWFQTVDGQKCYNPFSVCAKSVGTTSRKCGPNFDFSKIPDSELKGYAYYHKIMVPEPYNRQQMLSNIDMWKRLKYS